jgi:hypothetical protein
MAPKAMIARDGETLDRLVPLSAGAAHAGSDVRGELDMPDTDGRVTFLKNADGRVTGIRFRFGDVERDMKKIAP